MSNIFLDWEKTRQRWPSLFIWSNRSMMTINFPDSCISTLSGMFLIWLAAHWCPSSDSRAESLRLQQIINKLYRCPSPQNPTVTTHENISEIFCQKNITPLKSLYKALKSFILFINRSVDMYPCSPSNPSWAQALRDNRRGWSQIFFRTVSATKGDFLVISN